MVNEANSWWLIRNNIWINIKGKAILFWYSTQSFVYLSSDETVFKISIMITSVYMLLMSLSCWALVQNDAEPNMCFTLAYIYLACFFVHKLWRDNSYILSFSDQCILSCYGSQSTSSWSKLNHDLPNTFPTIRRTGKLIAENDSELLREDNQWVPLAVLVSFIILWTNLVKKHSYAEYHKFNVVLVITNVFCEAHKAKWL